MRQGARALRQASTRAFIPDIMEWIAYDVHRDEIRLVRHQDKMLRHQSTVRLRYTNISSLPYSGHATRLVLMGVYDHLLPACSRTSCLLAAFLVVHSNDVRTHNVSTTIG